MPVYGNAKLRKWGKGLLELVNHWRGNSDISDDITILEIWRELK